MHLPVESKKEFTETDETVESKSGEAGLGIKIVEAGFGKTSSDSTAIERTKVMHHELIDTIEKWLVKHGFALDLNEITVDGKSDISAQQFREVISNVSYVRVEGRSIIDDFARLQVMSKNFTSLVEFINQCNRSSVEDSEEYIQLKKQIAEIKREAKIVSDRNLKAKKKRQAEKLEKSLEKLVAQISQVDAPDEWLLNGIAEWIEQFNRDQIHLRVQPFANNKIEVTSNLKREYFVDTDIDHLLFSYGVVPNVKLTVFGLITSVPPEDKSEADTMADTSEDEKTKSEEFQSAFREVFRAMSEFEEFSGFDLYPNIKIYPIAVYRKIESIFEGESE